jgi:hypothetical protein
MWIFLNDSFLSIIAHREKPGILLVRARKAGDIEALFPNAKTWVDANADYPHRAEVESAQVAESVAERIRSIDYDNFKNSVHASGRHDAYMSVWTAMRLWGQRSKTRK